MLLPCHVLLFNTATQSENSTWLQSAFILKVFYSSYFQNGFMENYKLQLYNDKAFIVLHEHFMSFIIKITFVFRYNHLGRPHTYS